MITIDAAIELCENQISFSNEEYRKLASWLEDLKELRKEKDKFDRNVKFFNENMEKK